MCHLLDYLVRYCCNICSCQCTFCYMDWITYTCCDNLCLNSCYFEHLYDLCNEVNSLCRNVIQTSKERRNIRSSCSCCKKCLVCCKDQSYICLDSLCCKNFNSLQSFYCHRNLNYHVRMDLCNLTSFCDHAFCICCCSLNLSTDWSVYDRCDLSDNFFKNTSFFCNQRRVCCNSADHSHVICFLDILYISRVDKKFHF